MSQASIPSSFGRGLVRRGAWLPVSWVFCLTGCSGSASSPGDLGNTNTGGTAASGAAPAVGGAQSQGENAGTGGAPSTGGSATPGVGGNLYSGGTTSIGGAATGGNVTGGAANGGAATGGVVQGGTATGGKATGGASVGGGATGDKATGGASVGGSVTGGAATGDKATGGATTGGAAVGGAVTGGGATGGASTGGGTATACGTSVKVNRNPFSCKFGWGSSTQSSSSYQDFITRWVGYETNGGLNAWTATATNNDCGACGMVTALASTKAIPAFYTYWIGYQARVSGFGDCNVDMTDGHNLCTDGAAWILANWQIIVRAYAEYAKKVEAAAPGRASIWLLEGDLSQYVNSGQQSPRPLTWAELGQLVTDITCAIKSNHPNGMVYLNHSYWLTQAATTSFFGAMPMAMIDGMWMGGGANLAGKLTPATYTTVTYAWLHQTTGLPMYVGGQGASQQNWATATVTDLNARIADGVVAADIDPAASNAQTAIAGFATTLDPTCN